MTNPTRVTYLAVVAGLVVGHAMAQPVPPAHRIIRVELPASAGANLSGRMLLLATPAPSGKLPGEIDAEAYTGKPVTIAGQDIPNLAPGGHADIDADTQSYPSGFSELAPGEYIVQAILDTRRDFGYGGPAAGDLSSDVERVTISAGHSDFPRLTLTHTVPPRDPWVLPATYPADLRAMTIAAKPHMHEIGFQSPALSRFWGRPIQMRGWVLTPPGYDAKAPTLYPTVYLIPGFGGTFAGLTGPGGYVDHAMVTQQMPPMIWVFLDESSPTGTHEFADSVNNGPWGEALTSELIPALQSQYRMDPLPSERFLTGHSSGGWATLWLQTRYPAVFGGTWSTAPDPSDFHNFTNIDIYAPHANAYHNAAGEPTPLVRDHGRVLATFQQVAQSEAAIGAAGGQISSFDWVFSPRGPGGSPMPLFNRVTGDIDPVVAVYWKTHYDISNLVATNWPRLRADLTGKVHLIVGTEDTFYLDRSAHLLQQTMDRLHAGASFTFVPGRTHSTLYQVGEDRRGLLKDIAWDIYHVAKPGSTLTRPTGK